mmetsp:Transcript_34565/g.34204  ORF Transcript_34565/g.34204 Transcript_34565/m.34204 type:complete len:244 (-) Transcript_34565:28-759(-)
MNDDDTTLFYEHKIKNALRTAAEIASPKKKPTAKATKKMAQMKMQLYMLNKDKEKEKQREVLTEYNPVQKQTRALENSQKAVERDFIKQEENFRKRLAMRKRGKKILTQPNWGNESSINVNSLSKNNISIENSVELNSSDINFDKMSNSSMTDEMLGIIKTMNYLKRSDSVDKLKRARTLEEKHSESLRKSLDDSAILKNLNKSADSKVKKLSEKGNLSKIIEFEENLEDHSIELKEENGNIS